MWIKNELGDLVNIGRCETILVERETARNPNGEIVDMGGAITSHCGCGDSYLNRTYDKEEEAEKTIERIEKALKEGETFLDLTK